MKRTYKFYLLVFAILCCCNCGTSNNSTNTNGKASLGENAIQPKDTTHLLV